MKLKEVIVVEGVHDSEKLHRYFDVDTIETGGMHLSDERIKRIKKLAKKRGIILFLDPDTPGEKIRMRLNQAIPGCKNAFIDKKVARTSKKVGIEHANEMDLRNSLNNLITYDETITTLDYQDYCDLGFQGWADSKRRREVIGHLLFLGSCNAKTLYKRLNMYQISKQELINLLKEHYG